MTTREKDKQGSPYLTPILAPLQLITSVSSYIIMSIVLGTIVDTIGIYAGWWSIDHQLEVLASDIEYLGQNFTTSVFGSSPAELAIRISKSVQDYLTLSIHISNLQYTFWRYVKEILETVEPFWQNIIYSAMTVAVRCFIISMSAVFFIIVLLVAAIDGLVERELRKEGNGLEHAKVYHHSKGWIGKVLVITPVIYLSWPETINPGWIILPSAWVFGSAVYLTFSNFKKNL